MKKTLGHLGEFRLLDEVILPSFINGRNISVLGDDCSFVNVKYGKQIAISSDVAPMPLVFELGLNAYESWGWYAAIVNLSDLAAGGAKPLGIVTSIEAPKEMLVSDFEAFIKGLSEACSLLDIENAGGNLREAPRFACHGTVFGTVRKNHGIRRLGANAGDEIVSVGNNGRFMTAFLQAQRLGFEFLDDEQKRLLLRPIPMNAEMLLLNKLHLVSAASDCSDGVLGAVWNIIEASDCSAELDMNYNKLPDEVIDIAKQNQINPWNIYYSWGDWQVVITVPRNKQKEFWDTVSHHNIVSHKLGVVGKGPKKLIGREGKRFRHINLLRNESFVEYSFNRDIRSSVEYILKSNLYKE